MFSKTCKTEESSRSLDGMQLSENGGGGAVAVVMQSPSKSTTTVDERQCGAISDFTPHILRQAFNN